MHNNSNSHRHSIRIKGVDYSLPGGYFITVVTYQRASIFGDVEDGVMRLNKFGQIVAQSWEWLSEQYPYVELDPYIVMPNHFHGILRINELDNASRGGSRATKTGGTVPTPTKIKPLGQLVGAFKTVSAKKINQVRSTSGTPVWQRNYFEHIIQDEKEYDDIWNYVQASSNNWMEDQLIPESGIIP